jgi:uncharacterized protein YuzE
MAAFAVGRRSQKWTVDICELYCFQTKRRCTTPSLIGLSSHEDSIFPGFRYSLYQLRAADVAETKDLDEDTLLDIDQHGNICGITIEHASQRADVPRFSYEQIAA